VLNEQQKIYLRSLWSKGISPERLGRFVRNPSIVYKHAQNLFFNIDLRSHSNNQHYAIYKDSIDAMARLLPAESRMSFEKWLPLISNSDAEELGRLFRLHGSDKSTLHDYHTIYSSILSAKRSCKLNLLEIGIGSNNLDVPYNMGAWGKPGASLRAFREWAPDAEIFGADVDRRILFQEERISTFWVDQTNLQSLSDLASVLQRTNFDLIIDDGLHLPHANFNTLHAFLNLLKDDGVFVIEDIEEAHVPFWHLARAILSNYDSYLEPAKGGYVFILRSVKKNR
jgi:hypothetical protein